MSSTTMGVLVAKVPLNIEDATLTVAHEFGISTDAVVRAALARLAYQISIRAHDEIRYMRGIADMERIANEAASIERKAE